MLEADIKTLLATNGTLAAVPVTFASDPQSIALPKITLKQIGETRPAGSNDGDGGAATINLQINCIAATQTQAKTLAAAVKSTFFANMLRTFGATTFSGFWLEAQKDMPAEVEGGIEKPTQTTIQSWKVNF